MKVKIPVVPVVVVFFVVALLSAGLLGAVQPATGVPAEIVQLTQLGPSVGVVVVLACWPWATRAVMAGALGGRNGAGATRKLLSLTGTAVLIIAVAAIAYWLTGTGGPVPRSVDHSLALIAVAQFAGACAEEIGWRCLLQPLLAKRMGTIAASVVVGSLWGLWHVPALASGPGYAGAFLVAAVSMSIVLGVALEGVRAHRLLLAGLFHTVINLGMLLFVDDEQGGLLPMIWFAAACLAAAIVWTRVRGTSIAGVRGEALDRTR